MKRTKEQAAETRRQILRAAEDLFLDKGYENVTLDEIASACESSRGAVHWHFGNKQGLLYALRDEAQLPLQTLADCLDTGSSDAPLELLSETLCSMLLDLHNDHKRRGLIRVMMYLDIAISKEAERKKVPNDVYEATTRIFKEADRRGKLAKPWTPKMAASALNATLLGLLEEWALERSELQLVPDAQAMVRMVMRGFDTQERTNSGGPEEP